MQDDQYARYRNYLREEMRVEIGIPLSGGGVFRDWAIVNELVQDELLTQISRDVLPANVRVDVGTILDVSVSVRKEVYTCSGIVTEKSGARVLRIRLFGNFTLRERRQFFRIPLKLRIKYALVEDGSRRDVESDWERRREAEHMKFQGFDQFAIAAHQARYKPAMELEWHDILLADTNMSGGGMCINLPQRVLPDQLLALDIHLPLEVPRHVQAVAQVIHVMVPRPQKGGGTIYPAGLQFVFLHERDRDLLFRHISVSQIEYLRGVADRRDFREAEPAAELAPGWRQVVVKALWGLAALALVYYVGRYLLQYREQGPSGQIQKTYEKSIKEYRKLD